MNQKDYKEIAKIINSNWAIAFFGGNRILRSAKIITDLADYFEKEQVYGENEMFDRKQFLKDCGVRE